MRFEWVGSFALVSLLLAPPLNPDPLPATSPLQPRTPKISNLGAILKSGPNDCLSYNYIETTDENGNPVLEVICRFGGGGTGLPPLGGGGGGGGGGTTNPGVGGGGGSPAPGMPMPAPMLSAVSTAKELASTKLTSPQCAALFSGFTAPFNSGSFILDQWLLGYRSGEGMGNGRCSGSAAAWTEMAANSSQVLHSRYVMICDSFVTALNPGERSVRIIHEALHVAGLRENPPDPSALTTQQIDQMVREACGS